MGGRRQRAATEVVRCCYLDKDGTERESRQGRQAAGWVCDRQARDGCAAET